jgi:hypothetical protein
VSGPLVRHARPYFLVTDLGLLAYWAASGLGALPDAWLYKDHHDPLIVAWNWSFLPLDLLVSATGLTSLWLARRRAPAAERLAALSLALTSCSGLQAVAFWALRRDFDVGWWLPNLYLLLYPLPLLAAHLRSPDARATD